MECSSCDEDCLGRTQSFMILAFDEIAAQENQWLLKRLKDAFPGISPAFAFRGTANWMRALAILCDSEEFEGMALHARHTPAQRRHPVNSSADTATCEFVFMAFQNLSALKIMADVDRPADLVRGAIATWYYGVYYAASAMVSAIDGSIQKDHRGTASAWDRQVVQNGLIPSPFDWRLPTLIKKDYEQLINQMRDGNNFGVTSTPINADQAMGACLSSLKGTASHEREAAESRMKSFKPFKDLDVNNFKTKAARLLRDDYLQNKVVGFLHQAFRYRGKANYRDVLYLGYGIENRPMLESLITDLGTVLNAFLHATSHYCAIRIERDVWGEFVADIAINCHLALETKVLEV